MSEVTKKSRTPNAIAAEILATKKPQRILIIGGGYAGFYAAWKLEKLLGKNEAEVMLVDPLPT
jgi:NADH dehydrogenase